MEAEALAQDKRSVRASARASRSSLDPEVRREASAAACAHLLGLGEIRQAGTVLLYAAIGDEIDPATAVRALVERSVRVLFPRVAGSELHLATTTGTSGLAVGHRGVSEPTGPRIDPEVVDVAVVPGVAFDLSGGRLGQGGGHYDRLLAQLPAATPRVGLAFDCQVVVHVPRGPGDEPVDVVVTERRTHRTRARPGA